MSTIDNLHNRIDLINIRFRDRGSRLLLLGRGDVLLIKLAERGEWNSQSGHYQEQPPIIDNLRLLGPDSTPLNVEIDTFPHVVNLHTTIGGFDWTFVDPETLLLLLPPGRYGFIFDVVAQHAQTDQRGGTLHGKRSIAYTTNALVLQNEIMALSDGQFRVTVTLEVTSGGGLLINITPGFAYNRSIPIPIDALEEARARWANWFAQTPPVLGIYQDQYDYAWWILRAGLLNARNYFTREALVPSKTHYIGAWQWDQFFHAIAYRHIDTQLAENQLRIILDHQQPDGMFPDAIHDDGLVTPMMVPVDSAVTKPPPI